MTLPVPRVELRPGADARASLQRLHELVRSVNVDLDLPRTLQGVCQGVVDGLGFSVAVLNLVLPDGDLAVVACAGDPGAREALMGTRAGRAEWDDLLAACDPVGALLVDYRHAVPLGSLPAEWVPDLPVPDDPDAWHPLDQLFAPLTTARSGLVGVISVDLPVDGRRPSREALELLEMYAAQASVTLENAQLHDRLLRQAASQDEALGRLAEVVSAAPVAIVELDLGGRVRLWNPAAEAMFGWSEREVLGARNPLAPVHGYEDGLARLEQAPLVRVPVQRAHRDGHALDVEMSATLLRDDGGQPFGYLGVYDDLTSRLRLEAELRAAARTDPLTGLANRTLFTERLASAAASGRGTALLLLDLDGFKAVNDTAGHAAGDRVLVEVARRTLAACRERDLVARLGGDEFVVLLEEGASARSAERLAERLVEALSEPFAVEGRTVRLGASVGVARLDGTGDGSDLLRDADVAMYAAKAAGKRRYSVFAPQMRAAVLERAELTADLERALAQPREADEELFVRWHPVVRVADQRLLGFEALVRWQHPARGELGPGAFVPLAEESGLVVPLGERVLHRACRTLRRWQDELPGTRHTQISVNVSPRQVRDGDVVRTVREVLRDTRVHPGHLLLELTEEVLLEDVDLAVEVLHGLRELGVRLAIDDFGVGYSSLTYLKRLPVDVVKLDRSLLAGVGTDPSALALFDAVVGLVARLGLTAVAEGVETPAQWQLLERLRCPVAQGFLLARPLREQEVPRLLATGRPSCGTTPAL